MTPTTYDWVFVGFAGLAIGSFLNVCIWRLPLMILERGDEEVPASGLASFALWQRDVWRDVWRAMRRLSTPPSACPTCRSLIAWYHNVPVVGWIALGGRCASCRSPIAVRYPVVEAVTAALFLLHVGVFGMSALLWVRLGLVSALIVLFAIDYDHQLLPDVVTVPGTVVGVVASVFLPPGVLPALLGVAIGGGVLWAVSTAYLRWRGVEGLGGGDVKMLSMVGAFLGWKLALVTLLFGSLSGALVGVLLIALGRGSMGLKLPFGTFLATGALLASLWGDAILAWYLALFPSAG